MAKTDTTKCNGVEVTLDRSVKTSKDKDGKSVEKTIIKVSQKDVNSIKESFGCTKEVRDITKKADLAIDELGADLSGESTLKTGMDTVVKLGTGNGAITITRKKENTFRNPSTGEPATKFGTIGKQINAKVPSCLKDDDWQKKIEKSFGV
jgi:hypothetical protein